jgi:hypothetical protein
MWMGHDLPVVRASLGGSSEEPVGGAQQAGPLSALVEGRIRLALEREWRIAMALALRRLPAGICIATRDDGHQRSIGPVAAADPNSDKEVTHAPV